MKIVFILGKYQPGRCGISDYVRLLATELQRRGHHCRKISADPESGPSLSEISQSLPKADLVSLQFAPYAFSQSGTSGDDLTALAETLSRRKTHVLFHEIWIGSYPEASWKQKFRGWRQRSEILRFLGRARPCLTQTTNSAYLHRLNCQGIEAKYLYLFGNIPFERAKSSRRQNSNNELEAVHFGTLYDNFPYETLVCRLSQLGEGMDIKSRILVLGRQRERSGLSKLQGAAEAKGIEIEVTNERPDDEISRRLQLSGLGFSTTPYDVLGKSGATAAMLEHGLPVIAYDDGDTPDRFLSPPGPFKTRIALLNDPRFDDSIQAILRKPRPKFLNGVSHTAAEFLDSI